MILKNWEFYPGGLEFSYLPRIHKYRTRTLVRTSIVKPKTTPFWPQSANNQLSFPHNISLRPPIIILLFLSCWGGPALCRSYASVMQLKLFCIFIVKPLFYLYFSKLHHIHVVMAWMKKLIASVEFQYSSDVIHLIQLWCIANQLKPPLGACSWDLAGLINCQPIGQTILMRQNSAKGLPWELASGT